MIRNPIATFATGTYDVTRPGATTYTNGLAVAAAPTAFAYSMSLQPVSGEALKLVPEGATAEGTRYVLCASELRVRDVVTYQGEGWTVQRVQHWNHRGREWWEAWVVRSRVGI